MGGDAGSVGAPASRVVSAETRAIPPWTSRPGRHLQEEASASERPGSASREELCSVRARSAVRRSRRSPSAGPASVGWGRRGRRSTHLHGDRLAPCADWSPVAGHTGCSPTCATAGGQQGGGDRATRSRVCSARRARGSDRKQRGARGSVLDTHLLVLIPTSVLPPLVRGQTDRQRPEPRAARPSASPRRRRRHARAVHGWGLPGRVLSAAAPCRPKPHEEPSSVNNAWSARSRLSKVVGRRGVGALARKDDCT